MNATRFVVLFAVVGAVLFVGCSKSGSDDIPIGITAFNVYLYDEAKAPNADYFAGRVETSYLNRKADLDKARALAYAVASGLHFDTRHARYYIICTETSSSTCVTKIR